MTAPDLDLVTFGRICLDLYAEAASLAEAEGFTRAVGGCAGNIAIGSARLGLRVAIITEVGADPFGEYIRKALARERVATQGLRMASGRRTALAFAAAAPGAPPKLAFYREGAADAVLDPEAVDAEVIAQARVLAVSGAHAASGPGAGAVAAAIRAARQAGRAVALDIDHRPGFGAAGGAEAASARLAGLVAAADLAVGTEDEWRFAGGADDLIAALKRLRDASSAVFVVKRGAAGAVLLPGTIPETFGAEHVVPGFAVPVLNPLGAGDAFMAGFLSLWMEGAPLADCARRGNACGALVAGRLLCSAASPSLAELEAFLTRNNGA